MQKFRILGIVLVIYGVSQCGSGSETDDKFIVEDLVKHVSGLQSEHFEGDAILEQYVDALNEYSTYKLAGSGKRGVNLFERKGNDHEKEVVVLMPNEDKLTFKKEKQIYVGLKRAGDDDNRYYVFFIYVRNPDENDKDTVKIGGKDKVIEYDNWVNRQDRYQATERHFGWDECSSSIFVPCQTHQTSDIGKGHPKSKPSKPKENKDKKLEPIQAESGYDADDTVDFFWDLEDDLQQARFIEAITGVVGGLLSTVTGLLGGVLGGGGGGGLLGGLLGGGGGGGGLLGGLLGGGGGGGGGGGLLGGGGDAGGGGGLLGGLLGRRKRQAEPAKAPEGDLGRTMQLLTSISGKVDTLLNEGLMKTDLYSYPGWKTMDHQSGVKPGDTLDHEQDAFVGFGTCEYTKVSQQEFDKAKTEKEVIHLLTTALRSQCAKRKTTFFQALVTDEYLKFNAEKTFDINAEFKSLKHAKLSPRRRSELIRGLELSEFSKAYKTELYSKSPVTAPTSPISRRVHVFAETILEGIEKAKSDLEFHEMKLLRSLAVTVKTGFMKLLQDHEAIKECKDCKEDQSVNRADQVYLMSLLKFIIHGLGPVDKNPSGVQDIFKKFQETNKAAIEERVDTYL